MRHKVQWVILTNNTRHCISQQNIQQHMSNVCYGELLIWSQKTEQTVSLESFINYTGRLIVLLRLSWLRFLSRYFRIIVSYLYHNISCVCGTIYLSGTCAMQAWSIHHQSTQVSARFNHVPRTTWRVWLLPGDRGRAASPSVKDAATAFEVPCHTQVFSVRRAVFMTSQLTITSMCLRCGFQVSVLCSVWIEN